MKFANRIQAGKQLAATVSNHKLLHQPGVEPSQVLLVGLPRGGVPVALEVARKLGCGLDIITAKKLPFPGQPEYAIGAVSSDGVVVLNPDIPDDWQWKAYVEKQKQSLVQSTASIERQMYELSNQKQASFAGKIVIIVDDGIATGMTVLAAVKTARQRGAKQTIVATPVMSYDSYQLLRPYCDDIIVLSVPPVFRAVGEHYLDFGQTSNQEVVQALTESASFANSSRTQPNSHPDKPGVNNTAA